MNEYAIVKDFCTPTIAPLTDFDIKAINTAERVGQQQLLLLPDKRV
jgi:hypothetical protein